MAKLNRKQSLALADVIEASILWGTFLHKAKTARDDAANGEFCEHVRAWAENATAKCAEHVQLVTLRFNDH